MLERPAVGYCLNVHPLGTLEELLAVLAGPAADVARRLDADEPLGVGLWMPAVVAGEVLASDGVDRLRRTLEDHGLRALTVNGFPHADFHGDVVKRAVYEPTWADERRLGATVDLARVLAGLIEPGQHASISTLPLGWRTDLEDDIAMAAAIANLRRCAEAMALIEDETGRRVTVDLEPEPGCFLDRSADVLALFDRLGDGSDVRRHLGACHDVCHAAVMGEDQAACLDRYAGAGIGVHKVQVSSAIEVDFGALDAAGRSRARVALEAFAEPRYLHQTRIVEPGGGERLVEDLPLALGDAGDEPAGRWTVHFHVPIDLEAIGPLATTRDRIAPAVRAAVERCGTRILEVETYAWSVLPEHLRVEPLTAGIARELAWLRSSVLAGADR